MIPHVFYTRRQSHDTFPLCLLLQSFEVLVGARRIHFQFQRPAARARAEQKIIGARR